MSAELTKVDSAVAGLSISPKDEKAPEKETKKTHKRATSQSEGIWNIKDLGTLSPTPLFDLSRQANHCIQRSKRLNWSFRLRPRG